MENENMINDEVQMEKPIAEPMIPVHILAQVGDNNTPPEFRLSYSQVAFVKKEQYDIIRMRLEDMARTINGFIAENNGGGVTNG